MSQKDASQQNYGSARSQSRTQRAGTNQQREEIYRPQHTERQLHGDSPTRHDVQYYVRKVNRLESELARLDHELGVTRFRLSKAEDYQNKYDDLFQLNQKTALEHRTLLGDYERSQRELERSRAEQEQLAQQVRALRGELDAEKRGNEDLRNKKQELRTKSTNQGQQEREALKEAFAKELQSVKRENRDVQEKLKREISELKATITLKETVESALAAKLEHIKREKNSEIQRLKELTTGLKDELGDTHAQNEEAARTARAQLITETQDRIANVRRLAQLIEQTLIQEVNNLNETLRKKNDEINFLTECDKKQLASHQNSENALKNLVSKLEDKIFTIQRESQLELYNTIQRLKAQYLQNLDKANEEWDAVRVAHAALVDSLRKEIADQKKEIELLSHQNSNLQGQCKKLAKDQEHSVNMLSQKIIGMEAERDQSLKHYTTSMKQIEDDAKTKLDDLHAAIQTKNNESEILSAQLNLKNSEITHLLEQISRIREVNREKIRKLQTTNANEQDALNKEISDYKKYIFELKRNLSESEANLSDAQAAHELQQSILAHELQGQKQANEKLRARNAFLAQWGAELDRDLKAERVANVNILHDQNMSQRQNVQVREEVRVELQALKNKEVEQIKAVLKLEKNRLELELNRREHELREKKEELGRLLVQFKSLQAKVGKSSKVDRSAEDEGRCRATLQSEILLTENLFNAINLR